MLLSVTSVIEAFYSYALSPIMMVLILGVGIFLTGKNKLLQIRLFNEAFTDAVIPSVKEAFKKEEGHKSGISQFQAFAAAIAGTVGTGNIIGVSTALCLGGPGAIFWMWVSAFFGMATSFCENVLGIYFRKRNKNGEFTGGAMYYITHGLGLKWLGIMFAIFTVFASIGYNMAQVNSISGTLYSSLGLSKLISGIIVAILIFLVVIGGIKRIGKIASYVVPIMALIFITLAIAIIGINIKNVPEAFTRIFREAFSFKSFGSGLFGYGILRAMRYGVARGVFSNEAGLGSSVIAHCASNEYEPVRQGLWGIFEIFLDTFIICTLMAFVFLTSGSYDNYLSGALEMGSPMALWAFENNLGLFGKIVFTIILPLFAFTTVLSWEFYGEKSMEFLLGDKSVLPFKIIYVLLIILGAILKIELVWTISDCFNALMALPNLISLVLLSGLIKGILKNYQLRKKDKSIRPNIHFYDMVELEEN